MKCYSVHACAIKSSSARRLTAACCQHDTLSQAHKEAAIAKLAEMHDKLQEAEEQARVTFFIDFLIIVSEFREGLEYRLASDR